MELIKNCNIGNILNIWVKFVVVGFLGINCGGNIMFVVFVLNVVDII